MDLISLKRKEPLREPISCCSAYQPHNQLQLRQSKDANFLGCLWRGFLPRITTTTTETMAIRGGHTRCIRMKETNSVGIFGLLWLQRLPPKEKRHPNVAWWRLEKHRASTAPNNGVVIGWLHSRTIIPQYTVRCKCCDNVWMAQKGKCIHRDTQVPSQPGLIHCRETGWSRLMMSLQRWRFLLLQ